MQRLPACSGPCHQGRAACTCSTGRTHIPAGRLADAVRRRYLGWLLRDIGKQIAAVEAKQRAETDAAQAAALRHLPGPRGNARRRELRRQHAELVTRHRTVQQELDNLSPALPPRTAAPGRIALLTAVAAITSAAGLVLAACGGGGSDEEPQQPTPGVDCQAKPEQCK